MNKEQARKLAGQIVRLQPVARRSGRPVDDEWFVVAVAEESVTIQHVETKSVAVVGLDGIFSYFTDPSRTTPTQKCGFLQLLVQVDIAADDAVSVTPLPPPRATGPTVNPLDAETARLATQQYRSLWTAARAAVAYLLITGDATSPQVFQALGPAGYSDGDSNILARIASATQVIQRVEVSDTKQTLLLGYRGRYTINTRFRLELPSNTLLLRTRNYAG